MNPSDRRTLLRNAFGLLVALGVPGRVPAQAAADPRKLRPQEGDVFVHALGGRRGEAVALADLHPSSAPVTAWAKDPESGVTRDGSRLNQVLLMRLPEDELSESTLSASAEGVVAYSGICPHTGCDVSKWRPESGNLLCSCHDSEFDPRVAAVVKMGPAPRRLPALPLRIEAGVLVAAGGFSARITFQRDL